MRACLDRRRQGWALPELLIILGVLFIIVCVLIAPLSGRATRAPRLHCVNNLRQIGRALAMSYVDDRGAITRSETNLNRTADSLEKMNVVARFVGMSNELTTPQILWCPADKQRHSAANFSALAPVNISYFLALDPAIADPAAFLCGDRNITNGSPPVNGVLSFPPKSAAGWTHEIHRLSGNVLLSDGSVQQFSTARLRDQFDASEVTNRLILP